MNGYTLCAMLSGCELPPVPPTWFVLPYFLIVFSMPIGIVTARELLHPEMPKWLLYYAGFGMLAWVSFYYWFALMLFAIVAIHEIYSLSVGVTASFVVILFGSWMVSAYLLTQHRFRITGR